MNTENQPSKRLKLLRNDLSTDIGNNLNGNLKRTLHVEAVGVVEVVPDLCHVLICITSQKMTVSQAKDSVERRLAYVRQTIQNCHIQETETKSFQSVEAGYTHTSEIFVTSTDATKLYELVETLTQKLDDTVSVSPITFSISAKALAHSRLQSASNAVQNARKKATEMARLVEGSLGSPISVQQNGCEESSVPVTTSHDIIAKSQFNNWQQACMVIKSKVEILFELKSRKS